MLESCWTLVVTELLKKKCHLGSQNSDRKYEL